MNEKRSELGIFKLLKPNYTSMLDFSKMNLVLYGGTDCTEQYLTHKQEKKIELYPCNATWHWVRKYGLYDWNFSINLVFCSHNTAESRNRTNSFLLFYFPFFFSFLSWIYISLFPLFSNSRASPWNNRVWDSHRLKSLTGRRFTWKSEPGSPVLMVFTAPF